MRYLACLCLLCVVSCEREGVTVRNDGGAASTRGVTQVETGGAGGSSATGDNSTGGNGAVTLPAGTGGAITTITTITVIAGTGGSVGTGGAPGTGGQATGGNSGEVRSDAGADAGYRNEAGWTPYLPDGGENLCCLACGDYDGCIVKVHTTPFCKSGTNCYKGDGDTWPDCRQCQ